MVSKKRSDKTDNEAALIKNLNLFKSEIKIASMAQIEMALTPPMAYYLNAIYENLDEMTEQNDCYLATKLFRVLMRLVGKSFQGSANLMRT